MPATSDCGPVVTTVSVPFEILLLVPTHPSVYQRSYPGMAIWKGAMTLLLSTFGECAGPSPEAWAEALDAVTALSAMAVVQEATTAVMVCSLLVMSVPFVWSLESAGPCALAASRRRRPFDVRDRGDGRHRITRTGEAVDGVCPGTLGKSLRPTPRQGGVCTSGAEAGYHGHQRPAQFCLGSLLLGLAQS